MIENFEKPRKKAQSRMVALRDIGMGVVILLVGLFFIGRAWVTLDFNNRYPPDNLDKWFGVICFLYGGWRLFRGYQATRMT